MTTATSPLPLSPKISDLLCQARHLLQLDAAMHCPRLVLLTSLSLLLLGLSGETHAAGNTASIEALPANVGGSLRRLAVWSEAQPATLSPAERRARFAARYPEARHRPQTDADATRAVVDFTLDGTVSSATIHSALAALGVEILAQSTPAAASGTVLSARLPLARTAAAARLPGVASITLVRAPRHWVGKVTSQGRAALNVGALATAGFDGTGLTVGVISDSYDAASVDSVGNPITDHADDDILSGDLPGPDNPDNHLNPVAVLSDADPADSANTDEGRAMLQIVHDLAPGATLAFAANGATPTTLAASIRALRTNVTAPCDVIIDDAIFDEEPFFSDGPAALAVQDVVRSQKLAGHPVLYYSAAGDRGREGSYDSTFRPVTLADARQLTNSNLQLSQVPRELLVGGLHNFNPALNHVAISQKLTVAGAGASLNFQWDDPWLPNLISTSYSLLVFDMAGNYLPDLSGTDDAFQLGRAMQTADLPVGADKQTVVYQIAIGLRQGGLQQATHLRYLVDTQGTVQTKQFLAYNVPVIYGHAAATGADAVAAYAWNVLDTPEPTTSVGPTTIYIDPNGLRLATPDVRQQPTIAAVDGVNTTFFPPGLGQDTDGDGFPNFYGTSAAAAHAGAVAALLLEAAGGPGSLDDTAMRSLLQTTAAAHDLDPAGSSAVATDTNSVHTVTIKATGDGSDFSSFNKAFFQVSYAVKSGISELHKLVIDLDPAGLEFDPDPVTGFPFKISKPDGTVLPADVTPVFSGPDPAHPTKLVLTFTPDGFRPGDTLAFGVDRDLQSIHAGGNSADLLAGATIQARFIDNHTTKGKLIGTFANKTGKGYSPVVGYGLINAAAAYQSLQASSQ